jgi:hypothetical protein
MTSRQGAVALVIAFTLGVVIVVTVVAAAFGVKVSELTRDAVIGALGVLVGALVSYLAKK